MSSLDENFNELLRKIEHGRDFTSASFEPVYYLVFDPSEILDVKRRRSAWTTRFKKKGFEPHYFSMADAIRKIHSTFPLRDKLWLKADAQDPQNWARTNNSLKVALEPKNDNSPSPLQLKIEETLQELESTQNAVLVITDLEALHPYLRVGAIESQLYGQFKVPTVFLYPGRRTGKTRLSFLGFYPEDGNYRSVHVGG